MCHDSVRVLAAETESEKIRLTEWSEFLQQRSSSLDEKQKVVMEK